MSFQKHLMVRLAVDSLSTPRSAKSQGRSDATPTTAGSGARLLAVRRLWQHLWRLCTGQRNQADLAGRESATLAVDHTQVEKIMKQETIALVQQSWQSIAPIAPQAAELFYQNLFTADPSLRALFHSDMREQGHKLMQIIGAAIGKLDDTATLLPIVTALGRRHAGYGVQTAHYQTVGAALLTTLGQGLGDAFTPAVKDAWTEVYGLLAEIMVAAAVDMEAVTEVSNKEHDYVYSE